MVLRRAAKAVGRWDGLLERVLFLSQLDDAPATLGFLDVLAITSLHEAILQVGCLALANTPPVVANNVRYLPTISLAASAGLSRPVGLH